MTRLEINSLDVSAMAFAAECMSEKLGTLLEEAGNKDDDFSDIERIHKMRVTSRRLRAAMAVFSDFYPAKIVKGWRRSVRDLASSLGEARDADVQIELLSELMSDKSLKQMKTGIERLLLRMKQRRVKMQKDVKLSLEHFMSSGAADEMQTSFRISLGRARIMAGEDLKAPSEQIMNKARSDILSRLAIVLGYNISTRSTPEDLHSLRISIKKLRYVMEIFSPLYDDGMKEQISVCKKAQELLGKIHDCDCWISHIPQFIEEEESRTLDYFGGLKPLQRVKNQILMFQQDRISARKLLCLEFMAFWEELGENRFWKSFTANLSGDWNKKTEEGE